MTLLKGGDADEQIAQHSRTTIPLVPKLHLGTHLSAKLCFSTHATLRLRANRPTCLGFMKVLFFAQAREAAGSGESRLALDEPITQGQFWAMMIASSSALAAHQKSARLARNGAYMLPDEMIQPNDEIAVIPPVSGG
jgi:molybdopterin converting factor subunit 1